MGVDFIDRDPLAFGIAGVLPTLEVIPAHLRAELVLPFLALLLRAGEALFPIGENLACGSEL